MRRVRWMVREVSQVAADNGWRIFSEVDTEEYGELLATYWARFADTTTFTLPPVVGEAAR